MKDSIANYRKYGVSDKALETASKAEEALADVYARIDDIVTYILRVDPQRTDTPEHGPPKRGSPKPQPCRWHPTGGP